jgi:hypothetical protein
MYSPETSLKIKNMFKYIIYIVKSIIEQGKTQSRLNILFGKSKKTDYIKLRLPKNYVPMIEVIAMYGISDSVQLLKILEKLNNNQPKK